VQSDYLLLKGVVVLCVPDLFIGNGLAETRDPLASTAKMAFKTEADEFVDLAFVRHETRRNAPGTLDRDPSSSTN